MLAERSPSVNPFPLGYWRVRLVPLLPKLAIAESEAAGQAEHRAPTPSARAAWPDSPGWTLPPPAVARPCRSPSRASPLGLQPSGT